MKVLLTGSTGFLGRVICEFLEAKYDVVKLGRKQGNYICDLTVEVPTFEESFDVVIHVAGVAHKFGKTSQNYSKIFEMNELGTLRLLEGLDKLKNKPCSFVFISSVSVYGKKDGRNISENSPLLATEPYGKSKINAEKIISTWGKKNSVSVTILRLPLVVGENPPGNLGKMMKAIKKGTYFSIGEANVKKSMVLSKDIASLLVNVPLPSGVFNLTDGYHPTFRELEMVLLEKFNKDSMFKLSYFWANIIAQIGDIINLFCKGRFPFDSKTLKKINSELTFSDSKAVEILNWQPLKVLEHIKQ